MKQYKTEPISKYTALLSELKIHKKSINILLEEAKIDVEILMPASILLSYAIELGLKCLSFKSYENGHKLYSNSPMNTGIYRDKHNNYFYFIKDIEYKKRLILHEKEKIRNNITGEEFNIKELLQNRIDNNIVVSNDELFAIFKNYTPYPQEHNLNKIYNSITENYKTLLYEKIYSSGVSIDKLLRDLPCFGANRYFHTKETFQTNGEKNNILFNSIIEVICQLEG